MRIMQNVGGRSVAGTVKSFAALILSCCTSIAMLFAQAPSAPTHVRVNSVQFPEANLNTSPTLTYKTIDAPGHTYGYDVFADGNLMIHQTSVPALPGIEGFKTKEAATKVALLVIEKIKKGEMPPTVSVDEMKQLNLINNSIQ